MSRTWNEQIQNQLAFEFTEQLIRRVSSSNNHTTAGTYLVSTFRPRDDLPASASLRRMSTKVACRLAEMGFLEPVSVRALPALIWKVRIDAAELGLCGEYGNAFVERNLTTQELVSLGFEVVDGPISEVKI